MTTASYTSTFAHAADADFRQWGSDFSAMLDQIGFPKTADSGQINWATVSRPTIAAAAGYEVRHFNDSLAATAPIVVKIEFGSSGAVANNPGVWMTIGRGSDGAGNITGVMFGRTQMVAAGTTILSTTTAYPTYGCAVEGCVWWLLKGGGVNMGPSKGFFGVSIMRSADDSGAPTAEGVVVAYSATASYAMFVASYGYATSYVQGNGQIQIPGGYYTCIPFNMTSTLAGSPAQYQAFRFNAPFPMVRVIPYCMVLCNGDATAAGVSFQATPSGVTPRTYLCIGQFFSGYDRPSFIWE
ncbi:hypothetical protein [Dyella japonica]|uniref:Tail fiber protein n=1 Tax=Dyella japonica DSM 16301 TaxID=1440762 RepID=A0A0G9H846_9GAMM|nr:hypothetical protein [Dyella japonica]KLD65424.1 hypothetical protein Y882_02565 [Dyella japonica DSM 16301]